MTENAPDRVTKLEAEIRRLRADLVVVREELNERTAELGRERAGHLETAARLTEARAELRRRPGIQIGHGNTQHNVF